MRSQLLSLVIACFLISCISARYFSNFKFLDLPVKPRSVPLEEAIVSEQEDNGGKTTFKGPYYGKNERWNMRLFV
uniref:Uncharacterized protein n=1 Tax=Steinernema glaseri TaxID=37863 RepID=A0A1I7YJ29_9BILA